MNTTSLLQITHYLDKVNPPFLSIYVFLFVAIVLVVIKINNPDYFNKIFKIIYFEKKQYNVHVSTSEFNKSSFFLQFCFVLLVSTGIWIVNSSKFTLFSLLTYMALLVGFYLVQLIGFYLFSAIIKQGGGAFIKHRTSYNELFTLIFFPLFLILIYSPTFFPIGISVLLSLYALFSMVRVAIYLTRFISAFHIIVYLCTLELIPILYLLKFVLTN